MKVTIQHPNLPDGHEIVLTGLNAILLNNEEVEVDDEAIAQYETVSGKNFEDVLQDPVFTGIRPEPPVEDEEETLDNSETLVEGEMPPNENTTLDNNDERVEE